MNLLKRPRRNRKTHSLRNMIAETHMGAANLVLPVFITEGKKYQFEIPSMPGVYRHSLDQSVQFIERACQLGIHSVALFPYIEESLRDEAATEALNENGLVPRAIQLLKKTFPDLVIFADVALDPFSSLGHDGLVVDQQVINDKTVEVLAKIAQIYGLAGADFVAPSDMMDGRVLAIRKALDKVGCEDTGILSYAAKYASSFYGPFREALDSAPKFGDKKTYQMDFRNSREALREVRLDVQEGADIVMVKPALAYLDIIAKVKQEVNIPVAAYNVSGEYSMIKAAARAGWLDETKAMVESLYAMKRAGSDLIFTYFAHDMADWLRTQKC